MRSLFATSLLVMGSQAVKINPMDPSPNFNDWFEHPNFLDSSYSPDYEQDINRFINVIDKKHPETLVKNPNQYWVENWYSNSAMPIHPDIKWDDPVNLSAEQKSLRINKWATDAATPTNEQP